MYPIINIGNIVDIYTFGVSLVLSWILFFVLLHQFSIRKGFSKHIFTDIIVFTFSIFLSSRLFYILAEWREEKFIFKDLTEGKGFGNFLYQFFVTDNYNLSLAGGIIGFFIVFFIKTLHRKKDRPSYLDIIVYSFLLTAVVGYIGATLGGQIYGVPLNSPFSIIYDDKNSIVPFQNPLFPLPIVYALISGGIYWSLHRVSLKQELPNGFIGYMGMGAYGIMVFLGEFLNGSDDMIQATLLINMNQLLALFLITYSFLGFMRIVKQ